MGRAYRFVVFEAILVFVSFLASDDRASERLGLIVRHHPSRGIRHTGQHLLFSNSSGHVTVGTILPITESHVSILLVLLAVPSRRAEKSLGRLVDAEVEHIIIATETSKRECLLLGCRQKGIVLHGHVTHTGHDALIKFGGRAGC